MTQAVLTSFAIITSELSATSRRLKSLSVNRQRRLQERPKTANIGPKSGPRPPTQAPRAAQDRQHRPQQCPKTANIGPKSGPRPPTWAPRAAQDRQQRPQERPKTTHTGTSTSRSTVNRTCRRQITKTVHAAHQLLDRPSIDNIEEKTH